MAVVLKINPGFDASYPWREIGTGAQPAAASPLEYYLAPADKGGEPAGRWAGRGLATLGFAAGQVIDRSGVRAAVRPAPGPPRPRRARPGWAGPPSSSPPRRPSSRSWPRPSRTPARRGWPSCAPWPRRRSGMRCRSGTSPCRCPSRSPCSTAGCSPPPSRPAGPGTPPGPSISSGRRGGCGRRSWRATGRRWSTCRMRRG